MSLHKQEKSNLGLSKLCHALLHAFTTNTTLKLGGCGLDVVKPTSNDFTAMLNGLGNTDYKNSELCSRKALTLPEGSLQRLSPQLVVQLDGVVLR